MKFRVAAILASLSALQALALQSASDAAATPGSGNDCLMPSVQTCRLLPNGDGPHNVEQYCPGVGWINVFAVCVNRFGPYTR